MGDHVLLGRKCILMADVSIGNGSIVGTGAIVTKDIQEMCASVGVPSKVVKTKVTWSRFPTHLDDYSKKYFEDHHQNLS